MIKVGIVGGTGYTGVELLRILSKHPQVELVAITSRSEQGLAVADMYPNLRGHVDLQIQRARSRCSSPNATWCFSPRRTMSRCRPCPIW